MHRTEKTTEPCLTKFRQGKPRQLHGTDDVRVIKAQHQLLVEIEALRGTCCRRR
jgi:hypothetical protein